MEENKTAAKAADEKDGLLRALWQGVKHVIIVAWTVPAARNWLATQLIRFGAPSALVAVGMAIGEKLAQ